MKLHGTNNSLFVFVGGDALLFVSFHVLIELTNRGAVILMSILLFLRSWVFMLVFLCLYVLLARWTGLFTH